MVVETQESLSRAAKWYRHVSDKIKSLEKEKAMARKACLDELERLELEAYDVPISDGKVIRAQRVKIPRPVFDIDRLEATLRDYKYGHLIQRVVDKDGLEKAVRRQDVPYQSVAECIVRTEITEQFRADEVRVDEPDEGLGND